MGPGPAFELPWSSSLSQKISGSTEGPGQGALTGHVDQLATSGHYAVSSQRPVATEPITDIQGGAGEAFISCHLKRVGIKHKRAF